MTFFEPTDKTALTHGLPESAVRDCVTISRAIRC